MQKSLEINLVILLMPNPGAYSSEASIPSELEKWQASKNRIP